MPVELVANEAITTLNGAITAGATSMVVTDASRFPTVTNAGPATTRGQFRARISGTLTAGGTGTEYVLVTEVSGTTFTITRGIEPPYGTGLGFATGAVVEAVDTAAARLGAPFLDARQFGCKGDKLVRDDGAMTSASGVLTSATAKFAPADVGKIAVVSGAGDSSASLVTTIASWQSATQVTLTATAGTTVSAAPFYFGTDNTATLQAAITAAKGGKLHISKGCYLVGDGNGYPTSLLQIPKATHLIGEGADPFDPDRGQTVIDAVVGTTKDVITHENIDWEADYWAHGTIIQGIHFSAAYGQRNPVKNSISTATTGGTLTANTYSYCVTAVTGTGESRPCAIQSIITTGSTSTVTVNWFAPDNWIGTCPQKIVNYKVYGRFKDTMRLQATVSGTTLTWTDTTLATAPDPAFPVNQVNKSGQVRGSGLRFIAGENAVLRDLAFSEFPEAGLRVAKYFPVTTLAAAVTTVGQTAWTVTSGTGIANGMVLRCEDEWVTVTAGGGTASLTVTRASWGSVAATHPNGATVVHQGGGALSNPVGDPAPLVLENLCTYTNRFGFWADHTLGPMLISGWTGDDDNSQLAITSNTTDANVSGRGLTVAVINTKAECSPNTSWVAHHPWLYINNGNHARVDLLAGRISDWSNAFGGVEKNVVEIRQGWNGFNGGPANVKWRSLGVERYQNLLADYIGNELIPWYVGDDFPRFQASGEMNYRGQFRVRSELSDPKGSLQIIGPTNPMIQLSQRPAARLTANVTAAATSFPVTPTANTFRNGDIVFIESEQVLVTAGAGTATLTVTRGQNGTSAAVHWAGAWVGGYIENAIVSGQTPSPEGTIAAAPGSLYLPTTPTAGQSAYAKDTGTGTTGWIGLAGWELLAQTNLTGAATTTGNITVPARSMLLISYRIAGFSASAVGWLRFNNDSGQNYNWRCLSSVAGGATLANVESGTGATRAQIQFTNPAGTGQVNGLLAVTNFAANPKVVSGTPGYFGTASAATRGALLLAGNGEWVNTANQITQVAMLASTGNLLTNSGFAVFGRDA